MGSSYIVSLALLCLSISAIFQSSQAKNYTARSAVGAGHMTWDPNVVAYAQKYANQRNDDCARKHSGGGGQCGENITVGSGDFTRAAAAGLWVGEKPDYDNNLNSCARGKVCGHYTQVVWRNLVRLVS